MPPAVTLSLDFIVALVKTRKLEEELEYEKLRNARDEVLTWSISEDEFNKISPELGLNPELRLGPINNFDGKLDLRIIYMKDLVMDLFRYPSRYPGVIRQMRDVYNLRYKIGTKAGTVKNDAVPV